MSNLYGFPEWQIIAFALMFIRCVAFVIAMPIIGQATISTPVKILFSLILALCMFPTLKLQNTQGMQLSEGLILFAFRETLLGLLLGFLSRMFFFAINAAGEMIGVSSGLASAQLFNPVMGSNGNVFEQFHLIIATLFFLGINGHHDLLWALQKSFELLPITERAIEYRGFAEVATYGQEILVLAAKISAPLVVTVLVVNVGMGILGRTVPQINILVTSMQVTVIVTFVILMVGLPFYVDEMGFVLRSMTDKLFIAMKGM